MMQWLAYPYNYRVLGILIGGLLFRSLIAIYLPVGFDEAYYYVYTQHLSWSYFDHPPLVAFVTGFGVWLTGIISPLTIRLGALGLYTGSLIWLYRTSWLLSGQRAALLTLTIATLIPIFLLGFGVLTLPDSPLIFFWSATLYFAAQEFLTRSPYTPTARLALLGLLVGLACLSKYHGFALGFGLVLFCALSAPHRAALYSKWTGLSVVLFLLTIAPVLLWNAHHHWISFTYQSSRAAPATTYQWTQSLVTVLLSMAYLFPTFGLPMWWTIGRSSQSVIMGMREVGRTASVSLAQGTPVNPVEHAMAVPPLKPKADDRLLSKNLLLLCVSLPLILVLTYIGGYQSILPTWQMPGFWGVALLLGDRAALWSMASPNAVRRWLVGSGAVIVLLLLLGLSHVSMGSLQKPGGLLPLIPATSDASTQMIDIQQLRQGFVDQPVLYQALQQADFVVTNQIFIAGQIGMAIAPLTPAPVTCFSDDQRGFAFWSDAQIQPGKNALYVTSATFENEVSLAHPYSNYFQSIVPIGEIPIHRAGQIIERFKVFRANHLLAPYPSPYEGADSG